MPPVAAHMRVPHYCLHKARGSAYVRLDGAIKYLPGKYGSPESRAEYDRLVGLWQLNGRRLPAEAMLPPAPSVHLVPVSAGITVDQLIEAFLAECELEYPSNRFSRMIARHGQAALAGAVITAADPEGARGLAGFEPSIPPTQAVASLNTAVFLTQIALNARSLDPQATIAKATIAFRHFICFGLRATLPLWWIA